MNTKRALVAAILLAWMPLAIGVAYPQVYKWSNTASSNASADPSINWREGMAPSAVNDSARAMMAALANYRDDISGALATTGTASAYFVTTNQGLPSPPTDGQMIAITVNNTNGISPTLSADGGTSYPVQSSAGVAIPSGTLISGSPYSLKFSVANSAWMLRDFYPSSLVVPLGGLLPYTAATAPNSNYILPAGQCISTTTYATYWALLGSPASGSCSGGQFAVIDLRGRTLVALDNLNGSAANRLTSASTGCGTAMTSVGAVCANGVEGFATTLAQLPTGITSTGNISVTSNDGNILSGPVPNTNFNFGSNSGNFGSIIGAGATSGSRISQGTNTLTSNNTSGTAHPSVQPTISVAYLLRVI